MPLPLIPPVWTDIAPIESDVATFYLELEVGATASGPRTRPGTFPDPEDAPGYVVKLVDMAGNVLAELEHANPQTITRTVGQEREAIFESPKYDEATAGIDPLTSEIQIFRNDDLKFWGPIINDDSGSSIGATSFDCRDPWWYFRRRVFGSANRLNHLFNTSFENGLLGWRVVGSTPAVVTVADSPHVAPLLGDHAVCFFAEAGTNGYIAQAVPYETTWPTGQSVDVVAWVYLYAFTGPAAFGLGLLVSWVQAATIRRQTFVSIDDSTPTGQWVKLEAKILIPPEGPGAIEARLYAPGGVALWDHAEMILNESTGTNAGGDDQTELARRVVLYGQTGRGKSSLRVGTRTPASNGKLIHRAWRHEAHDVIADAMDDLAGNPDGFDYAIDVTPRTRTFRTFYPFKGTDRSDGLTLELGVNLASYERQRDGTVVVDSLIAKGPGDDASRDEGGSIDASALGGLILEDVATAPDSLPVDELDDWAATQRAAVDHVIPVLTMTTSDPALIDLLDEGDLVHVRIDDGSVQVDAMYRLAQIVLNCRADNLTLTGNLWTGLEVGS